MPPGDADKPSDDTLDDLLDGLRDLQLRSGALMYDRVLEITASAVEFGRKNGLPTNELEILQEALEGLGPEQGIPVLEAMARAGLAVVTEVGGQEQDRPSSEDRP